MDRQTKQSEINRLRAEIEQRTAHIIDLLEKHKTDFPNLPAKDRIFVNSTFLDCAKDDAKKLNSHLRHVNISVM